MEIAKISAFAGWEKIRWGRYYFFLLSNIDKKW